MKRTCVALFMLFLPTSLCARAPQIMVTPDLISGSTILVTPPLSPTVNPSSTPTLSPTMTSSPEPPTHTSTAFLSPTSEPAVETTAPPTGTQPGVLLAGRVTHPGGDGIEGVQIRFAFSAYPGNLLTTTNSRGEYEGFIFIPHDETVRIWAELSGYAFKPGKGKKAWMNGEFAWHHYGNFEFVQLDFIGTPQ